jgi:hypothetical protein
MRTLMFIVACAVAGLAWADNSGTVVKVYSLDVKERIQTLELINVTVEKPASEEATKPDTELQAILDDVEAIEEEDL